MDDPRETRKIAANWREYLSETLETFRVFIRVWHEFVTPQSRRWIYGAVVGMLLVSVFGLLQPLTVKYLIDSIVAHDLTVTLWSFGIMAGLLVLSQFASWLQNHCREIAWGHDISRLDVRSTELFLGKSLGQHIQDSGELTAANVEKGRNRVMEIEYVLMFDGLNAVFDVLVAFGFLFVLCWQAGLVMLGLFVIYLLSSLYQNRQVLVNCTPLDADFRAINRYRVERWDNPERVKTNGKEGEEVAHLESWYVDIISRDRKFWLWFIKFVHFRQVLQNVVVVLLIGFALWQVWDGAWTVGMLFPFISYARRVNEQMWRIGSIERRMNKNMPSVRSMMNALAIPNAVEDLPGAQPLTTQHPVELRLADVSYVYPRGDDEDDNKVNPPVLAGLDFRIEPGEKVALVGPSGAGKTTVMRLVQRFMDPSAGQILVDGHDLRTLKLRDWQHLVGYIPQQPQVLDGTIKYNLLYGLPAEERASVTDEELERVVQLLKIDFGERLVDGLDTVVGRRGIKLSGGQAQRLMVGAAVLKRPRFMVIDEATSSLDSTTEKAVQDGLQKILGDDVSALVVTHRLSTVRELCSKFVVLRALEDTPPGESQVEAIGSSFEELVQMSATFKRLAEDQGVIV